GGGLLLYLGGREGRLPVEREQDPVGPESARDLEERVRVAGESTLGPAYRARVGEWCVHCEVRSSCPAQPAGRQVTGGARRPLRRPSPQRWAAIAPPAH